jgi:hypothetical protein
MAALYDSFKKEFERIRDYVNNDLNILLNQPSSGNYLAVSLITCACDALSCYKYGKSDNGEQYFSEMLLPLEWQNVGTGLYNAPRNGLVHSYDTKTIEIKNLKIDLSISWEKQRHLSFSQDKKKLYINVKDLAEKLKESLIKFEIELKENSDLRETFIKRMKKDRVHSINNKSERDQWFELIERIT